MKPLFLKIKKIFRITIDLVMLPYAIVRLFLNPNNVEPMFKLGTFRDHLSFQLAEKKIMTDPQSSALVRERYLYDGVYDIEKLAQMPEGSLGHAYGKFMKKRNLKPNYYHPVVNPKVEDAFAYARQRCPQTHDIWHVVLGIDTTPLGEMKISAFYVAQIRSPFNALFIGIGLFVALFRQPEKLEDFFNAITMGWTMGQQAKPLFPVKWENLWHKSMQEIRAEFAIPLVASGVAAVNE